MRNRKLLATSVATAALLSCGAVAFAAEIVGTGGPDLLLGTSSGDEITGLDGDDTIVGFGGADIVRGGSGDDIISGEGTCPNTGSVVVYCIPPGGAAGADRLFGGSGQDQINGHGRGDRIAGQGGDDEVRGGGGDDRVGTGSGEDFVHGDGGADKITAGTGEDRIWGDGGRDRITPGSGKDDVFGGGGNDTIFARDGSRDRIRLRPRFDVVFATARDRISDDLRAGALPLAGLPVSRRTAATVRREPFAERNRQRSSRAARPLGARRGRNGPPRRLGPVRTRLHPKRVTSSSTLVSTPVPMLTAPVTPDPAAARKPATTSPTNT